MSMPAHCTESEEHRAENAPNLARRAESVASAPDDPDGTAVSLRPDALARLLSQPYQTESCVIDDATFDEGGSLLWASTVATLSSAETHSVPTRTNESTWEPGAEIGARYQLMEAVAAGAWGTVWRARQLGVDRYVAIKVLKAREAVGMSNARSRFEREAKLASRIRHPSAVRIVDFGYDNDRPYLVMEWLEGTTVAEYIRDCGPMPPKLVLDIGMGVCAALHSAHEEGVIHRDLKPSNIMLVEMSNGLTPVVVDFGLARTFEEDEPTVTRADMVIGTPAYMCPEAIRGQQLSHASDIYSLGVTLIEALLGFNPFRGESSGVTMTNHLMPRPLSIDDFMERGCPRHFANLLLSMVAIDVVERPISSRSIEEQFRSLRHDLAYPPPLERPSPRPSSLQAVSLPASLRPTKPTAPAVTKPARVGAKWAAFGILLLGLFLVPLAYAKRSKTTAAPLISVANALPLRPTAQLDSLVPSNALDVGRMSVESPLESPRVLGGHRAPSWLGLTRADSIILSPAAVLWSPPAYSAVSQRLLEQALGQSRSTRSLSDDRKSENVAITPPSSAPAEASEHIDITGKNAEPSAFHEDEKDPKSTPKDQRSVPQRSRSTSRATSSSHGPRVVPQGDATLVITASPPGRIRVNGQNHGMRSSLLLRKQGEGRYLIEVQREGSVERRSLQLESGQRKVEAF